MASSAVLAGLLYAPLLAARILCGRFARPAALAGLAWGATRGVLRMIALRGLNPANLLAQVRCSAVASLHLGTSRHVTAPWMSMTTCGAGALALPLLALHLPTKLCGVRWQCACGFLA